MTTYTDRHEATYREIIEPLGEWADNFDIEAIADEALEGIGTGTNYRLRLRGDIDFWDVVEKHAIA